MLERPRKMVRRRQNEKTLDLGRGNDLSPGLAPVQGPGHDHSIKDVGLVLAEEVGVVLVPDLGLLAEDGSRRLSNQLKCTFVI